jgi:hypothetical protein
MIAKMRAPVWRCITWSWTQQARATLLESGAGAYTVHVEHESMSLMAPRSAICVRAQGVIQAAG